MHKGQLTFFHHQTNKMKLKGVLTIQSWLHKNSLFLRKLIRLMIWDKEKTKKANDCLCLVQLSILKDAYKKLHLKRSIGIIPVSDFTSDLSSCAESFDIRGYSLVMISLKSSPESSNSTSLLGNGIISDSFWEEIKKTFTCKCASTCRYHLVIFINIFQPDILNKEFQWRKLE